MPRRSRALAGRRLSGGERDRAAPAAHARAHRRRRADRRRCSACPAASMRRSIAAACFDRIASATAALLLALPVFVLGTLLVLLLAQTLRLMPAGGYAPISQNPAQHFTLLALPAIAIAQGTGRDRLPHDARFGARRAVARLRAHGARQGPVADARRRAPCRAQRADAGAHRARPADGHAARRHGAGRVCLQLAGPFDAAAARRRRRATIRWWSASC